METFYDIGSSDFKDMWETDLDPAIQEAFKLPPDPVMQDWLFERDIKMPQVILHDKLMTDALLGTIPIKSEHSYSLNSDGDSMPDSPGSLQNKMDDMDDECYPTISMNSAHTSHHQQHTTNSNCSTSSNSNNNNNNINNCRQNIQLNTNNHNNSISIMQHSGLTANTLNNVVNNNNINIANTINNNINNNNNNFCNADTASIISCGSDIDVDDSTIKEEPLSPGSSCPPSPNGVNNNNNNNYTMNVNLANMAAYTNTDLVFEHKNGSLQLSPASQSLLKNQQIIFGSTTPSSSASSVCSTSSMSSLSNLQQQQQQHQQQQLQQHRVVLPKLNIKMEPQTTATAITTVGSGTTTGTSSAFGLPPTPPSSLPSDDSEGNQSPEHHLSPMSPPATLQTQTTTTPTSRRTSVLTTQTPANCSNSIGMSTRTYNSTRQPIHTPLISSQPKGSTGTLVLTEEEKRTLQAEGYPIPTRLPLTKAEEKSLKKIRRKIKNKISAQESRRKKKEYMDQLERKVEILVSENTDYRKRVESLEDSNTKLLNQLAKLEASITRHNVKVK